jgi:hypothetical protein
VLLAIFSQNKYLLDYKFALGGHNDSNDRMFQIPNTIPPDSNGQAHDEGSAVTGSIFKAEVRNPSHIKRLHEELASWGETPLEALSSQKCTVPMIGVTTTLKGSSKCIEDVAGIMKVIVVADRGAENPSKFLSKSIQYLTLQDQHRLYPNFSSSIPKGNFARKNIGYMHAVMQGACFVWDFDDDNFLTPSVKKFLSGIGAATSVMAQLQLTSVRNTLVNPYLLYGSPSFIWPRGYPIELLKDRDFPKLELPPDRTSVLVDIVQVMQEGDPDVDADWRIMNSQLLPMQKWEVSGPISENLVAIDRLKWAPFNAQATLMSRRAVALAMLPHSVHGRVSDIWRSYVMQYIAKNFFKAGAVAFSGHMVEHRRNPHSYMADRAAETQLVQQVAALVDYLNSRPLTSQHSLAELVFLMDDLYQRKFIEESDVAAAVEWARVFKSSASASGGMSYALAHGSKKAPNTNYTEANHNIVAVLHINSRLRKIVPSWMALHSHRFQRVEVYIPGGHVSSCNPISGVKLHCISNDFAGYHAYESMVHSISHVMKLDYDEAANVKVHQTPKKTDGFLFLHDDVFWKKDVHLAGPVSWRMQDAACISDDKGEWNWIRHATGMQALNRFATDFKKKIPICYGQADEYYVSNENALEFFTLGLQMRLSNVFLEIAIPMIFSTFSHSTKNLSTVWEEPQRQDAYAIASGVCSDVQYTFGHPVKLSSLNGIKAHLAC